MDQRLTSPMLRLFVDGKQLGCVQEFVMRVDSKSTLIIADAEIVHVSEDKKTLTLSKHRYIVIGFDKDRIDLKEVASL